MNNSDEREKFEARFPVPEGVEWSEERQRYRYNSDDLHGATGARIQTIKFDVWQAARVTPALPQAEHDLEDVRCQCCGYMTYHSEHMGCIRSAYKQALPQVPEGMAIVPVEPTEAMLIAARDWSYKKYGKPIGNDAAQGCWQAMLAAAKEKGE